MIIVLTGPTGSGKSDLAIKLANKINGAIINADAFQVYKELNIASAKPSIEDRSKAPHYLFDFLDIRSDYDIYSYQKDLRRTIAELESVYPYLIIAGGTGLYIRSGLYDYDLTNSNHVDMSEYESLTNDELYSKLLEIDPISASKIHKNNRRRVIRAIEIYLSTGERKSDIESTQSHSLIYPVRFFGLNKEREEVYKSCDARVDKMFAQGLLKENQLLFEKYGYSPHAFQAIGVKETIPYFKGEASLEQTKELIKLNTRHYVKRQLTFFAHQFDLEMVSGLEDLLAKIETNN
ncbi:MAG: tRNA (adenosine(37)-N6)-dimethylallyltransferase MiaA [Bacilli bacterium]|nr:tRNA (adenosine(37)-N6)-dimethylallyltransferase MiaA [Bacilli bacterium]